MNKKLKTDINFAPHFSRPVSEDNIIFKAENDLSAVISDPTTIAHENRHGENVIKTNEKA